MKKQAWIRSDRQDASRRCPFGLPITEACHHAGGSVTHMCPLSAVEEEKQEHVEKANKRVYIYYKDNSRCLYAANIMGQLKTVNCNFEDTAQGMHAPAMSGSPLYAQTFSGVGIHGLYAFPLGMYCDNNESRNLFTGLFSLVGHMDINILKQAGCNPETLDKLSNNKKLTYDEILYLISTIKTQG